MAKDQWNTGVEYLDNAFNEIDAALFSGDGFEDEHRVAVLERYVERWSRKVVEIKKELAEDAAADTEDDGDGDE
ncbi:hypothetical protein [Rhizobium sp. BK176]|uniref:hypothetical protein n=1 Tax=Rhizobium sp. BK176 TaxID=2587071 RepID=UPI00216A6D7A|nr:hypothetical protein [Rhizobium sp. BK176]MCS4088534.1 hypothetical protein [Rhizobium sp. BK176]